MFKSILVCLDGSPMAEQIIPLVNDQAKHGDSKVVLFHVLNQSNDSLPSPLVKSPANPDDITQRRVKALDYLEGVARPLKDNGVAVECQVTEGKPAESIVDYAEKNRPELIALTTHGEGGLGHLVFGSTAVYVLRESSRPVLIIKPQRNSQL
jgi:nucleotide-binding universal stress UspA family protein